MLADKEQFEIIERSLLRNGTIDQFENEYGKITGRMMITLADIPDNIEIKKYKDKVPAAFEASFDFYDSAVGIAVYTMERQAASKVWVRPQKEGAGTPSEDWITFFIKTLISNISEDGSFGVPIYSFVNDTSDLTVIPTAPTVD